MTRHDTRHSSPLTAQYVSQLNGWSTPRHTNVHPPFPSLATSPQSPFLPFSFLGSFASSMKHEENRATSLTNVDSSVSTGTLLAADWVGYRIITAGLLASVRILPPSEQTSSCPHPHIMPRLRMRRAIFPLLNFIQYQKNDLTFTPARGLHMRIACRSSSFAAHQNALFPLDRAIASSISTEVLWGTSTLLMLKQMVYIVTTMGYEHVLMEPVLSYRV
jgi:hypothetical protein